MDELRARRAAEEKERAARSREREDAARRKKDLIELKVRHTDTRDTTYKAERSRGERSHIGERAGYDVTCAQDLKEDASPLLCCVVV